MVWVQKKETAPLPFVLATALLPPSRGSLWDCVTRAMDREISLNEETTGSHILGSPKW